MKKFYTPVSFTFVIIAFVALLMNQNGYMVIAFSAAVLLCLYSAFMDYERDQSIEGLRADLKSLTTRIDSLTTTVGLKGFGR